MLQDVWLIERKIPGRIRFVTLVDHNLTRRKAALTEVAFQLRDLVIRQ